ncbi:hypothetical protein NQ318_015339 [Aromia moschata]|uniref:Uncharacterized protein n=1 Tax=Aromia moschata TaxID=1265417 RepID=A0AAV8YQE9_9CUCU|nr:hypothetical protein NQ318_015339 [Aromia moschata]
MNKNPVSKRSDIDDLNSEYIAIATYLAIAFGASLWNMNTWQELIHLLYTQSTNMLRSRHTSSKVYDLWIKTGRGRLSSIVSAKLVPELLAAVPMLHLYFGTWGTGAIIKLRQKHQVLDMQIHFKTLLLDGPVTIQPYGPMMIIFTCDFTVKESRKLLVTCSRMERYLPLTSKERSELLRLEDQIRNNRPSFTAAGFFQINRSTLLSLISTTTTYFIIVLQFRNAS